MRATVLVGMSVAEARERDHLQRLADERGATVAFLQHGDPSLVRELDRLAAAGADHITLEPVTLTDRSPARSWLGRVASHWVRGGAERPEVEVDGRLVGGSAAPLVSPAWEHVPRHHHHVLVCRGPRCSARGADDVADRLNARLGAAGLGDDDVLVAHTGCLFPCNHAPVVVVHPDDAWFGAMDDDGVDRLVEHLATGELPAAGRLLRQPRE